MTREEAIKRLEDTFEGWNMWVMDNDSPASKMSKALDMAISALREQEERSKGCEWCESRNKKTKDFKCGDLLARGVVEHTFWGDGRWYTKEPKFCPMCGRRLEEV